GGRDVLPGSRGHRGPARPVAGRAAQAAVAGDHPAGPPGARAGQGRAPAQGQAGRGRGGPVRRGRRPRAGRPGRPDRLFHPRPGRGHAGLAGRPAGGRGLRDHRLRPGQAGPSQDEGGRPAGAHPDHRDGEGGRGRGQDPDAIRQDIAQTRPEMSETVEAVGYKADVPSRAKDAVSDKVENMKSKVSGTATRAKQAVVGTASRVGDATPSGGDVKQKTKRVAGMAKENPLGLAIGAAALGFLAGLAVPSTRVEDEKLGRMSDQVMDKVKETGQEALDRGRQVAQEVASTATETAKDKTQEHGQELANSAKQNAEDLVDQTSQTSRSQIGDAETRRLRSTPPQPWAPRG